MQVKRLLLTASAALFFGGFAVAGTVVYSDLPVDPSSCCGGYTIGGASSIVGLATPAMAFTPSTNVTVTQIDVAIGVVSGTSSLTLTLNADDGSGAPGAVIDSWTGSLSSWDASSLFTATGSDALTGGDQYWLVATVPDDTWAAWTYSSTGDTAPTFVYGSTSVQTPGAFDVLGSAAPEPATMALGGGVLLLLTAARRRGR